MNILTANLLFSTLIFWIAATLYLLPRLPDLKPRSVLLPILLLHSFRHLGLMFLAPGATYAGMPMPFAYPAAFGDPTDLHVFDVWDSQAEFDAFGTVLMPILTKNGITPAQPQIAPIHNTIKP